MTESLQTGVERDLQIDLGGLPAPIVSLAGPELASTSIDDVGVRRAWEDGSRFVASRCRALLHFAELATFLVEDGERVSVWEHPGCDSTATAVGLNATVIALVLAQRGMFILHANAVETSRGAAMISGDRGAGKSTTSAQLQQMGARVIADDLCPLVPTSSHVHLLPTPRPLRLPESTIAALGIDVDGAHREPLGRSTCVPSSPSHRRGPRPSWSSRSIRSSTRSASNAIGACTRSGPSRP